MRTLRTDGGAAGRGLGSKVAFVTRRGADYLLVLKANLSKAFLAVQE